MEKVEGESEGKNTESDEEFPNFQYQVQTVPQNPLKKGVTLKEIQLNK